MTRIASRHSGRRTSPASRRSRLKSDIGMYYCISRFTMQEQILQLSSTVKLGGATSPLPATPSRNRTKRQNQSNRKNSTIPQSNFYSSWGPSPEVPDVLKQASISRLTGCFRSLLKAPQIPSFRCRRLFYLKPSAFFVYLLNFSAFGII